MEDAVSFRDAGLPSPPSETDLLQVLDVLWDEPPKYDDGTWSSQPAARKQKRSLFATLISKFRQKAPLTISSPGPLLSAKEVSLEVQKHGAGEASRSDRKQSGRSSAKDGTLSSTQRHLQDLEGTAGQTVQARLRSDIKEALVELPTDSDKLRAELCAYGSSYHADESRILGQARCGQNKVGPSLTGQTVSNSAPSVPPRELEDTQPINRSETQIQLSAQCATKCVALTPYGDRSIELPIRPHSPVEELPCLQDQETQDCQSQAAAPSPSSKYQQPIDQRNIDQTMPQTQVTRRNRPGRENDLTPDYAVELPGSSGVSYEDMSNTTSASSPSSLRLQCLEEMPPLMLSTESPLETEAKTPASAHAARRMMTSFDGTSYPSSSRLANSALGQHVNRSETGCVFLDAKASLLPQVLARYKELALAHHHLILQQRLESFTSHCNRANGGEDSASGNGSSYEISSISRPSKETNHGKPAVRKRKIDDEGDDPNRRRRSRRGSRKAPAPASGPSKKASKKLACPYNKKNPGKYCETAASKKYKICERGFRDTKDLQGHLKTVHRGPKVVCGRCSARFSTDGQREAHLKQITACEPYDDPEFEEEGYIMSDEKEQALKKKAPSDSEEQHWIRIWDILFPGANLPDSIYKGFTCSEAAFDQAVEEVVPRYVRQYVDERLHALSSEELEKQCRSLMTFLRDQIYGISQPNLFPRSNSGSDEGLCDHSTVSPEQLISDQGEGGTELMPFNSDSSTSYFGHSATATDRSALPFNEFPSVDDDYMHATLRDSTINLRGSPNDFLTEFSGHGNQYIASIAPQDTAATYPMAHLPDAVNGEAEFYNNPFPEPFIGSSENFGVDQYEQMQAMAEPRMWSTHSLPKAPMPQTNPSFSTRPPNVGIHGITYGGQERRPHLRMDIPPNNNYVPAGYT